MTWAEFKTLQKVKRFERQHRFIHNPKRTLSLVAKRGVIKAQCKVDRWVGILKRHIPLCLLCDRTRSRFETPFR